MLGPAAAPLWYRIEVDEWMDGLGETLIFNHQNNLRLG